MVKVTLEFTGVDEAIVALGKLVGTAPSGKARGTTPPAAEKREGPAPVAAPDQVVPTIPKPPRKPRADAGQSRGPYKNAAGASAVSVSDAASAGGAAAPTDTAGNSTGATTDTSSTAKASAGASTSTTASAPGGGTTTGLPPAPSTTAPAAPSKVPSADDVQAAVEKLFAAGPNGGYDNTAALLSRFGVKRGKDLPEASRVEFIRRAADVAEGKYKADASWPDLA